MYRIAGTDAVQHWLTPHWSRSAEAVLADPHRGNSNPPCRNGARGRASGCRSTTARDEPEHGDPRRFHCTVTLPPDLKAEGWGGSRRDAEQRQHAPPWLSWPAIEARQARRTLITVQRPGGAPDGRTGCKRAAGLTGLDRFHGDDSGGDGDDPETGNITTAASNCPCTVWGTKSP